MLLIFPPQWTPFRPYHSLPSLTAYLQSKNINVVQKDFNLEAYDLLLSKDYLLKVGARLEAKFAALDARDSLQPGTEQKYYSDLIMTKSIAGHLAATVDNAKSVYRDPASFYDPEILSGAIHTLNQALVELMEES